MQKRFQRGIWWVKRDFRIDDNEALLQAVAQCESVMALLIIEPGLCQAEETSAFHYQAWQSASAGLHSQLARLGTGLHIVISEAVNVFEHLFTRHGFDALFSHQETGSDITFQRDLQIRSWSRQRGIPWQEYAQNGVIRRLKDRDERSAIIRQRLFETPPNPPPSRIRGWTLAGPTAAADTPETSLEWVLCLHPEAQGSPLTKRAVQKSPDTPWPAFSSLCPDRSPQPVDPESLQPIDELCAYQTLSGFLSERGLAYAGGISSPNTAMTAGSRLSVHLAWGTVSLRRVFHALHEAEQQLNHFVSPQTHQWRKSLRAFRSRLHWHDHFIQRLESAPAMEFAALNPAYRSIGYADQPFFLQAWLEGKTGLPLVDACMRCLQATGFLNFRMRAMIVSVACFGLAQSWRSIQYPLARLFLDYEPGIHFSQIQMQAGIVGINTLRIYSPHKQLLDQDTNAVFVKRWIPELRSFSATEIAQYNERTLGDYPEPITDITANTRIIRDQVYAIRQSEAGKSASQSVLEQHGSRKRNTTTNSKKGITSKKQSNNTTRHHSQKTSDNIRTVSNATPGTGKRQRRKTKANKVDPRQMELDLGDDGTDT